MPRKKPQRTTLRPSDEQRRPPLVWPPEKGVTPQPVPKPARPDEDR